jgi:hypothetical protein
LVHIRPAPLRLNGKAERSHRVDAEEFHRLLDGVVLGDAGVFNERLKEWEDYRRRPPPTPRWSTTSVSSTPSPRLAEHHPIG